MAIFNSDGSATNVQSIHDNQAQDGDTITLPAGSFTWSIPVAFTKAVSVTGAGTGSTTIFDNVPKPNPNGSPVMWSIATKAGSTPRFTGFTIHGMAPDPNVLNAGTFNIGGGSHAFRVDHINFVAPGTGCIITNGDVWGVIDHCNFDLTGFHQGVQVHHGSWNGDPSGLGDFSWEGAPNLGTNKFVFIEDCSFNGPGTPGAGATDGSFGGRFVFRHNTVTSDQIAMHGTEGGRYRGMRCWEIYNNTFTMASGTNGGVFFNAMLIRSGAGVIHDNVINFLTPGTGYRYGINMQVYRDAANNYACGNNFSGGPWGALNGTNPWDGNQDSSGYPGIDQTCYGQAQDQIRGGNSGDGSQLNQRTGTKAWPRNIKEGLYEWNNTFTSFNGSAKVRTCDPAVTSQNRDYFTDTTPTGYTPFTYPHPLTGSPPPPTMTITLTWQDNSNNEDGFDVERSTDGTNFNQIAQTAANVVTFDDTTVAPATQYFYRVRAFNTAGNSAYSNVASATTGQVIPVAPSNLVAVAH